MFQTLGLEELFNTVGGYVFYFSQTSDTYKKKNESMMRLLWCAQFVQPVLGATQADSQNGSQETQGHFGLASPVCMHAHKRHIQLRSCALSEL